MVEGKSIFPSKKEPEKEESRPGFTNTYIRPEDKDIVEKWAKVDKRQLIDELSIIIQFYDKAREANPIRHG